MMTNKEEARDRKRKRRGRGEKMEVERKGMNRKKNVIVGEGIHNEGLPNQLWII